MCRLEWASNEFEVYDPAEFISWITNYWPEATYMNVRTNTFILGPNHEFFDDYVFGENPTNLPEYRRDPETENIVWQGDHEQGIPGENAFLEELSYRLRHDSTCILQLWSGCYSLWVATGFATAVIINGGDDPWEERVKWLSLSSEAVRAAIDLKGGRRLLMAG